jgi:hypothetical protein
MTRDTAEAITGHLLLATRALNEALMLVESAAPESVFIDYQRRTRAVLGAIYVDLMKPIVARYPDIDPIGEDAP